MKNIRILIVAVAFLTGTITFPESLTGEIVEMRESRLRNAGIFAAHVTIAGMLGNGLLGMVVGGYHIVMEDPRIAQGISQGISQALSGAAMGPGALPVRLCMALLRR